MSTTTRKDARTQDQSGRSATVPTDNFEQWLEDNRDKLIEAGTKSMKARDLLIWDAATASLRSQIDEARAEIERLHGLLETVERERGALVGRLGLTKEELAASTRLIAQCEEALSDLTVYLAGREDEVDTYTVVVPLYRLRTAERIGKMIAEWKATESTERVEGKR
jgi:hypothetical protein